MNRVTMPAQTMVVQSRLALLAAAALVSTVLVFAVAGGSPAFAAGSPEQYTVDCTCGKDSCALQAPRQDLTRGTLHGDVRWRSLRQREYLSSNALRRALQTGNPVVDAQTGWSCLRKDMLPTGFITNIR